MGISNGRSSAVTNTVLGPPDLFWSGSFDASVHDENMKSVYICVCLREKSARVISVGVSDKNSSSKESGMALKVIHDTEDEMRFLVTTMTFTGTTTATEVKQHGIWDSSAILENHVEHVRGIPCSETATWSLAAHDDHELFMQRVMKGELRAYPRIKKDWKHYKIAPVRSTPYHPDTFFDDPWTAGVDRVLESNLQEPPVGTQFWRNKSLTDPVSSGSLIDDQELASCLRWAFNMHHVLKHKAGVWKSFAISKPQMLQVTEMGGKQ